ncbi:MAG: RelA/SpoT domain-containing protein [Oscillospiraceae bacterium]
MTNGVLELNGLSIELLKELSFRSSLGISLKKDLRYFPKDELLNELFSMTRWYDGMSVLADIALDYRVKSKESILKKYERYFPDSQARKTFNDILGFRAFCDDYNDVLALKSENFRLADMSSGKANDDGYRGIHLYFQLDNSHYPIEIQYNTMYDRQLNNWLHEYVYKRGYPNTVGQELRKSYENSMIKNEKDFTEVLNHVLSGS